MTRLALVNAIYFKGNWMNRFDEANTKEMPFKINQVGKLPLSHMHRYPEHGWCLSGRPVCIDIKHCYFFHPDFTLLAPLDQVQVKGIDMQGNEASGLIKGVLSSS